MFRGKTVMGRTYYDKTTGEIQYYINVPEKDYILNTADNMGHIEGYFCSDRFYVFEEKVFEKTSIDIPDRFTIEADGYSEVVINLPPNCYVSLDGQYPVEVVDNTIVFNTFDIGTHTLKITGVPYLPMEVIIEAN